MHDFTGTINQRFSLTMQNSLGNSVLSYIFMPRQKNAEKTILGEDVSQSLSCEMKLEIPWNFLRIPRNLFLRIPRNSKEFLGMWV